MIYQSTKIIELGSCAFRQWRADSHCKFVHGYRLVAKFWFNCTALDEKNWVVDFGGLKGLKEILENQFDHTLCIAGDDPALPLFQALHDQRVVDLRIMDEGVGIEKTAEWCLKISDAHIRDITNNRCWVDRVEVWEHDKNSAIASHSSPKVHAVQTPHVAEVISPTNPVAPVAAIHTTVAAPSPEISNAARVGNKISTGLSNPFGGTSWGL